MTDTNKPRHINDLVAVMDTLLSPTGCPWDREQTPKSLTPFAIEEAYELAEAIEKGDVDATKEELGDLLMQVIFHSALARNAGQYTLEDVIEGICTKLIRRHPHVFGGVKVANADEVLVNWAEIKNKEKTAKNQKDGIFNIPPALPALQRAQKIGDKTRALKFDWSNTGEVFAKVEEEVDELKKALGQDDLKNIEEELGDTFFALAQLARHLKLEAETVARGGNRKFEARFEKLMKLAEDQGLDFKSLDNATKEDMWQQIKKT